MATDAEMPAHEHVRWVRSVTSPLLTVVAVAAPVLGLVMVIGLALMDVVDVANVGSAPSWIAGSLVIGIGLLSLLLASARVRIDDRGVAVVLTGIGWPRVMIGVDEIESAAAVRVTPSQFGGWGYRIVPGGAGVIMCSGQALRLVRTSGRTFTVTVGDAETAAGLINRLVARAR